MMVLNRLPFCAHETTAIIADGTAIAIRKYQIVAWISLSQKGVRELPADTPRFPAILDTGHNHNFSIRHDHLRLCLSAGQLPLPSLPIVSLVNGQPVPHFAANLWLHRNRRGQRDLFVRTKPVCLELAEGIAVTPAASSGPRLPLIGLRALVTNRLVLTLDGAGFFLSLKSKAS